MAKVAKSAGELRFIALLLFSNGRLLGICLACLKITQMLAKIRIDYSNIFNSHLLKSPTVRYFRSPFIKMQQKEQLQ